MLQIGNKEIKQMNVGNTSVREVYLGSELVWPSAPDTANEWYGVEFSSSATTGTRIGNLEYHKTLPLQSQMRRCVITNDQTGEVKFIKDDDYTQFEDGSTVDYSEYPSSYSSNIMVHIPEFWYSSHYDADTDTWTLKISAVEQEGWVYSPVQYVGAFEATQINSIPPRLVSSARDGNTTPAVSMPISNMQAQARQNGTNWNAYTYKAHKAITFLFIVEYANRNSQAAFNSQLTSEGYHQGGLGNGLVSGSAATAVGATMQNVNSTVGGNSVTISYRGIENPFGNVWKNLIDVWISANNIYYCEDPSKYTSTNTVDTEGYELIGLQPSSNSYVKSLYDNEMAIQSIGASASTYFCDYYYQNSGTNNAVLVGGSWGAGSSAGLLHLSCTGSRSYSNALIGTRLTYELHK